MSNEYGFFAAKNHDRSYSADDFCAVFNDFFTSGVLGGDTSRLAVSADDGMTLSVSGGTAYIKGRWFRRSDPTLLTLPGSDVTYPRYDAIVLRCDTDERMIYLTVLEGMPSDAPERPAPERTSGRYELVLAYVYVAANAHSISQADISDTRGYAELCGYITGTVKQIDASGLFEQYQAAWDEFISQLDGNEHVSVYCRDDTARIELQKCRYAEDIESVYKFI